MENNTHINNPSWTNEPHKLICLLIDTSGSMGANIKNNPIGQLNDYFMNCKFEGHQYDLIDLAIVGFSHNAYVIQNFAPLSKLHPFVLSADGPTAMGEGINLAIDLVKERIRLYANLGTPIFRPCILMLTDGQSTDDISNAIQRIKECEEKKKLTMWAAGIIGSSCDELKRITKRALYIDIEITKLSEFLDYMLSIIIHTSEEVQINKPDGVSIIQEDLDWIW